MAVIKMNRYRIRKAVNLASSKPLEISVIIFIIWATFYPLRFPNIKGYKYLKLNEVKDDLQICLVTRRPHDFKLCPLVSQDLGM